MSYTKVVYLRPAPLSQFVYNFLEIENLLNSGIEVEYLNTSGLYTKELKMENFDAFKGSIKIDSNKVFKEYLIKQNASKTLFINLTNFNYKSFKIFFLLNKYNFNLALFARYGRPTVRIKTTIKQKLDGLNEKVKNRLVKYIASIFKNFRLLKYYDYIFVGGNKSINYFLSGNFYKLDRKKVKVINVNANDYDKYLSISNKHELVSGTYCVFLDQYIPYHPDFIIHKKKTVDPTNYYDNLNRTFDKIEKKHNVKVIIAAHPKALNYKEFNPFKGRAFFYEKTPELVSNSSFVIAHFTTSINFAILYNKPLLFFTCKDFEQVMPASALHIKEVSQTFNSPLIYFDKSDLEKIKISADIKKYSEYKYNYMTSPESEDRLTSDILIEFLKNIQ